MGELPVSTIRGVMALVLMWVTLAIMAPPYVIGCLFDRGGVRMYWMQVLYLRFAAFYAGMKLKVSGLENLKRGEALVLMSNHRSYFDIPAIQLAIYPHQVRFVAKRELAQIPFLGQAIRYGGHILIERDNREKAVRTLQEFAKTFTGAYSVVVFPEGTRSPGTHLQRFKRGGFYLARELGAQIVPISISGSQHVFGRKAKLPRAGTVTLQIHEPIDLKKIPDNDRLIVAVRERIESGLLDGTPAPTRGGSALSQVPER